ncbi:MAG: LLM class flavin-dependent oxidoreductase [Alphaproteobacteria bacterium]|nr:LLM class flavin-dependent oxidoreductase [Alphaproteobacteria bacterium]
MGLGDTLIIGVSVNNVTGISGKSYALADLLHAAIEAEAMGFDAIWVHDAPLGRRTLAAHDPLTILAAVAAKTSRLRLGTGILTPQLRNPVFLAQQWATLFALSDGRAIMGVGSGAGTASLLKREFAGLAALRHDTTLDPARLYERRGALFDEALDIVRRLWSEDKLSYSGEIFRFDEVTLGEARPPSMPPILVAGGIYHPLKPGAPVHHGWSERHAGKCVLGPYKRIALYGDGWITVHLTPEEYDAHWARIQAHAEAVCAGKIIAKAFNCFVNVDPDPAKARQAVKDHLADFHGPPIWDDVVERWAVAGPPERVAARLQDYIDRGVRIFQLVIGSPDQLGQMRRIAEEVLPLIRRPDPSTSAASR